MKPLGHIMLKLITGELVISNVTVLTNEYLLENPMAVMFIPQTNKKGQIIDTNVLFNQWIEFSIDTHLKIPKSSVITIATPDTQMIQDYILAVKNQEMQWMQTEFNNLFSSLEAQEILRNNEDPNDKEVDMEYNDPNQLPLDEPDEPEDTEDTN